MTAKWLNGRLVANLVKEHVKQRVAKRLSQQQPAPGLDVILVGNDPASEIYVQHKQRACAQTGIQSRLHRLPADTTATTLIELIQTLNTDARVHGILLQVPLPAHLEANDLLERIAIHKDVDGFHPYNVGRLAQRRPTLRPCTPYGIIQLIDHYGIDCRGKHAVIVGASNIVGRPMALEFLSKKSTVTVCHRFTQHLQHHVQEADILVAAIGKPGIIQSDWIAPNAIVIDAGITRLPNGSIVGDLDFETAQQRASYITPVPGGVGPMTVAMLLKNTVQAAETESRI